MNIDIPYKKSALFLKVICTCFLFFILCTPFYFSLRPAVPKYLVNNIEPGMASSKVEQILGQPQNIASEFEWEYWRWGNSGWLEIHFNENNRVISVNDESVFP